MKAMGLVVLALLSTNVSAGETIEAFCEKQLTGGLEMVEQWRIAASNCVEDTRDGYPACQGVAENLDAQASQIEAAFKCISSGQVDAKKAGRLLDKFRDLGHLMEKMKIKALMIAAGG